MKIILIPTDFSDASKFASEYIFDFYKNEQVRYHLIHSYDPPSGAGSLISIDDIVKKDAEDSLKEEIEWMISLGIDESRITSNVFFGEFTTVINREAKNVNADLIVLGTTGCSGLKKLIGSNTSALIQNSTVPVLAIPLNAKLPNNNVILFPVNLSEEADFSSISLIRKLAVSMNTKVEVFYASITGNDNYLNIEKQKTELSKALDGVDFVFTIEQCEDVSQRILDLIEQKDYSLLVMMPHKYGILKRLFTTSVTNKVVMKISIPLLSIH